MPSIEKFQFHPRIRPTEESLAELTELGLTEEQQIELYGALAKTGEYMVQLEKEHRDWMSRPHRELDFPRTYCSD